MAELVRRDPPTVTILAGQSAAVREQEVRVMRSQPVLRQQRCRNTFVEKL